MPENDTFPLDCDYGLAVDETDGVVRQRAEGGRAIQWQQRPAQRIFTLPFGDRPTDDVEQLRDWKRRFASSFFIFEHKVWVNNAGTYLARKFPVEWLDDTLPTQLTHNESNDFQVRLIEAVGRAYPAGAYPDPAVGHPSWFQEETALVKEVGTWSTTANANAHGGSRKQNTNLNTTDYCTFVYTGCGFRLWVQKGPAFGILELFLDSVSLGNVDLYAAAPAAAAVVFSKLDVTLGLHVVKIKNTNTRNASSTDNTIIADALEVLP